MKKQRLIIVDKFSSENLSDKNKKILERAALTCPVGKSLHANIKQDISFIYPEE